VVSVHAAHYTRCTPENGSEIQVIPGLGRTGRAVSILTPSMRKDPISPGDPVVLEYCMYIFTPGSHLVHCYCLPTHPLYAGSRLSLAVSFDEQPAQQSELTANGGEHDKIWQENVLRGATISITRHRIQTPGWHTLKITIFDRVIILDKIVMDIGGLKSCYLGPLETRTGLTEDAP
jgi:hypothetical protein